MDMLQEEDVKSLIKSFSKQRQHPHDRICIECLYVIDEQMLLDGRNTSKN